MIDHLRVGRTANFYKLKKRLAGTAVTALFRQLRAEAKSPSQNLFSHVREHGGGAIWSAIAFFQDHDPNFLRPPPAQTERICGYLFLVEHRGYVAVFKSGLDLPSAFKTKYLERVPQERVEAATAKKDAIFEKIRLRNMSASKLVLRSKTLEAGDLSNAVGPAGASRYAPQSYATRLGGERFSATPNTGRISQRSEIAGYGEAMAWACEIIDDLATAGGETAPFIQVFARAMDLRAAASGLRPRSFVAAASAVADELFADRTIRFVRPIDGNWSELGRSDTETIIGALDEVLPVQVVRKEWRILEPKGHTRAGGLRLNASRIALRELDRHPFAGIFVESTMHAVGMDPDRLPLRNFLDHNDHFVVLFEDPALAYLFGTLYRDNAFAAGDETLLRHIKVNAGLVRATSEKGDFATLQAEFDANSVFGILASDIARDDAVLVCDDLGDEWADFIGINESGGVPILTPSTAPFRSERRHSMSQSARP